MGEGGALENGLTSRVQSRDDLRMKASLWWVLSVFLFLAIVPCYQTVAQPSLGSGAIVNGASFAKAGDPNGALAPGAIVSAFGSNFATGTQEAPSVPLSTSINGSSLTFFSGGTAFPAPMFFASSG